MKHIIAALPIACIIIDKRENLICANDLAHAILGPNIEGRHFVQAIRTPDVIAAIEAALSKGDASELEWRTSVHKLESFYTLWIRKIDSQHVMVSFEDRTQSEQTRQMRRDFVSNVSHELRTPLTSILGFLETLQTVAKDDATARVRFLDIMRGEAERMNRLVNDLLSLNQVESNIHMRPTTDVDVREILLETSENLSPNLEKNNVSIAFEGATDPLIIKGDRDQLRQVFTNLIENAIKYGGPHKTITVTLGDIAHQKPLRGVGTVVHVTDHGEGIGAEHISRLTERFYRVDKHRSREVGGTGLGLSIVKHIISRHRGRLEIESVLGQGSTFSVFLPR